MHSGSVAEVALHIEADLRGGTCSRQGSKGHVTEQVTVWPLWKERLHPSNVIEEICMTESV